MSTSTQHNRFEDLAIAVFKENQLFLSVDPDADNGKGKIEISFPDFQPYKLRDLKLAAMIMSDKLCANSHYVEGNNRGVTITGEKSDCYSSKEFNNVGNSVVALAGILADAGVNFPGSERYKSKEKSA
ncbi:MAG: hypothetical protein KGI29_02290 [Pseudomonadota bacterium]|nr:hypothetical protein [Pseudomonadota bacterium]MDE3037215.1 hypothetical protein [Pseudomonadota bacterium]